MSPPARALLAFAAAALLHAATADSSCTTVVDGPMINPRKEVLHVHLDQTDSVTDIPPAQCALLGVEVTACDPFGAAPRVELLGGPARVHVTCVWTAGLLCPQGIDLSISEICLF